MAAKWLKSLNTLFMTKTAEKKNIPFGAAHTYTAHIREYSGVSHQEIISKIPIRQLQNVLRLALISPVCRIFLYCDNSRVDKRWRMANSSVHSPL